MYDSVEELRQLEFHLHAVMVHEGSIDSGHYWAYVRDHKRKVTKPGCRPVLIYRRIDGIVGPGQLINLGSVTLTKASSTLTLLGLRQRSQNERPGRRPVLIYCM